MSHCARISAAATRRGPAGQAVQTEQEGEGQARRPRQAKQAGKPRDPRRTRELPRLASRQAHRPLAALSVRCRVAPRPLPNWWGLNRLSLRRKNSTLPRQRCTHVGAADCLQRISFGHRVPTCTAHCTLGTVHRALYIVKCPVQHAKIVVVECETRERQGTLVHASARSAVTQHAAKTSVRLRNPKPTWTRSASA